MVEARDRELRVGPPLIVRGGASVRPVVRDIPVDPDPVEEWRLDPAALAAAGLFEGRAIDLRERRQKAVVGKEARVRQEVVLTKETDERMEAIDDNVRRTDVTIEELDSGPSLAS